MDGDSARPHTVNVEDDSARLRRVAFESGHQLLGQEEGYIVGSRGQMVMRLATEAPIVTIGKTGAGKGVSAAIPNMLDHPGSIVSLEIGGVTLLESINYRRDVLKQKIVVFDPHNATGYHNAYYNPLDDLPSDGRHPEFWSQAVGLATTIAKTNEGEKENQVFFQQNAIGLLASAIMYLKMADEELYPPEKKNLVTISRIFSSYPSEEWKKFIGEMRDWIGPQRNLINQYGNYLFTAKEENKTASDIVFSTSLWLKFISDDTLADCMKKSNVSFRNLRDEKTSIYIVMKNPETFQIYHPWLRFILESVINLTPNPGTGGAGIRHSDRILMLLDEMTHLGKLDAVMTGAQTVRQKGITLWSMFQSMGDLIHVYGKEKAFSFISSAECVQVYQVTEPETLDYLVKKVGRDLFYVPSVSHALMEGTSKTDNVSWSNAHAEGESIQVTKTDTKTDTTGETRTKGETKQTGTSQATGTTATDTVTHTKTTGSTIGTTVTEGSNNGFTINHSYTSGSQWNGGWFSDYSHGGSYNTTNGSSSTYGTNSSVAHAHSTNTSDAVAKGHSSGTTLTDTFSESLATSISIAVQASEALAHAVGTATGSNVSKTVTEQKGTADAVNNSYTYTTSYAPQILPAIEWRDIENMLTGERQILLVNNSSMSLRLLDYQARFYKIPFLKIRADGPILLPPPEYAPDYLSKDIMRVDLVPESAYAFAPLPAAKLPEIKRINPLHDIPVTLPSSQRQATLRELTSKVSELSFTTNHLDVEVPKQASRLRELSTQIADLSRDSAGMTRLKVADWWALRAGLPAGLATSALSLSAGGGMGMTVTLGLAGIVYTAGSVISHLISEDRVEQNTAIYAQEYTSLAAQHAGDSAKRQQAHAALAESRREYDTVQRGVLSYAERALGEILSTHETIDRDLGQCEAIFNDRVQKAASGLQAVRNGVAATKTLSSALQQRQSVINAHISKIDENNEKHRSVIGAWKNYAEYLLSYLDMRGRWYSYKHGHLPAPTLEEIPSFGNPGAARYEFPARGVSVPLTPLPDFDLTLPKTLPAVSSDFGRLRTAASRLASAKKAGGPLDLGLINEIQSAADQHINGFARAAAERINRLAGGVRQLGHVAQELEKKGGAVNAKIHELGSSQSRLIGYEEKINSSTDALLGDIFGGVRDRMQEVRVRFDEQTEQLKREGPQGRPLRRTENRPS